MKKRRSRSAMCRMAKVLFALVVPLALARSSNAQIAWLSDSGRTTLEDRASVALEAVRSNPLDLRNLLFRMPKGADLHNHLSGAVYAESWIRAAAEDRLCIEPAAVEGTKSVFSPGDGQQP